MVFSSVTFLIFFLPIALLLNFTARKITTKNAILLILSLIFYAWGEPVYVFLMMGSILINYLFGISIAQITKVKIKKIVLGSAILLNLSVLFFFKYLGWATELILPLLSKISFTPTIPEIILPIGISFYTFQIISYIVDVYRNPALCQKKLLNLGLYISFFPQLIAGPIVRYNEICDYIKERKFELDTFVGGVERFIIGLGKKTLLANTFAFYADSVLNLNFSEYTSPYAWCAMLAYSLQIYFDFSGYSDMAIGLGKMFGFKFPENFNFPYAAKSITEFWRRWHISLSSWFREYLYIPLGGNRRGNVRTYFNIFLVFLATGIWHGAASNFLFWGLGHGLLRMVEKFLSGTNIAQKLSSTSYKPLTFALNIFKRIYTLSAIILLWIFFRNSMSDSIKIILKMAGINYTQFTDSPIEIIDSFNLSFIYSEKSIFPFLIGIFLTFPWWRVFSQKIQNLKNSNFWASNLITIAKYTLLIIILILCISSLASNAYNPFIYFRF